MRFAKAYVEITNICNFDCAFCPKTKRAPASMTAAQFRKIAEALRPYTDYLYLHVMGEPLLHPALETLLACAAEQGFRVILTTNGRLLPERETVLLACPALHKVNVSIHAPEANPAFSDAGYLSGCLDFAQRAAAAGKLVSLRLWNLDGAETNGLHTQNETILAELARRFPQPWAAARDGKRLAERVYLSFGERFVWPSLDGTDYGARRFCYGLKDQIGVLADGTVVPCCLDHEGDLALGNLLSQSLEEILVSPRAQAIQKGFRENRAVEELCRRCGYSTRFLK